MSWCDNYDLSTYTPNGIRETHAMAVVFQQKMNDESDDSEEVPTIYTSIEESRNEKFKVQ